MQRPYTAPGFGWLLAIIGLILVIVFWATHALPALVALLFVLVFLALLL